MVWWWTVLIRVPGVCWKSGCLNFRPGLFFEIQAGSVFSEWILGFGGGLVLDVGMVMSECPLKGAILTFDILYSDI